MTICGQCGGSNLQQLADDSASATRCRDCNTRGGAAPTPEEIEAAKLRIRAARTGPFKDCHLPFPMPRRFLKVARAK